MKHSALLLFLLIIAGALVACESSRSSHDIQEETKKEIPTQETPRPVDAPQKEEAQVENTGQQIEQMDDICEIIKKEGYNTLKELPVDDPAWTSDYDNYFRKYAKRFFGPGIDWRWFKAQGITESGLREDVKSWVGAKGIMQIMPKTFTEIQSKQSWIKNINDPKWNIPGGIYYDNYLYRRWDIEHSTKNKMAFMFSSYNCGRGCTLRAQRKYPHEDCDVWENVAPFAPKETRNYVKKIFTLMDKSF
ncbi:MAG: transglycosylase SLT domain-containing protein [bacterium]